MVTTNFFSITIIEIVERILRDQKKERHQNKEQL
jgi:hypothetical protein